MLMKLAVAIVNCDYFYSKHWLVMLLFYLKVLLAFCSNISII